MSPRPPSWNALVRCIAAGEERALAELYEASHRRVYGLALALLGDATLAEEITLEVFVQVWREAPSYDPSRGSVPAWISTLARSRSIDLRRSLGRRGALSGVLDPAFEMPASEPSPLEVSEARDSARELRQALRELPEPQRQCLMAAYFGGHSHSEVAQELELPLGTVKTRIRAGLSALRRCLINQTEQSTSRRDPA